MYYFMFTGIHFVHVILGVVVLLLMREKVANAPTGVLFSRESIRNVLSQTDSIVVVDEAYVDFAGETAIELLPEFANLIVTRTFSKSYALAGMRVVTGTGDLLNCNAGLVKNATGYDIRHLMVGSEGTLGLICEVDIRLEARPEPQTVMVVGVPKVIDLLNVLSAFSDSVTPHPNRVEGRE